jgi:acetyl esterase/lipase
MKSRIPVLFLAAVLGSFASRVPAQDPAKSPIVYSIPEMGRVLVRQGIPYTSKDGPKLNMDIYYPPDMKNGESLPAVVIALGYANGVFETKLKDWEFYVSWGKLIAASGMIAVNYETTQPSRDIEDLMSHLRGNAAALKIDADRIGIWACSANALTALTVLSGDRREFLRCAVLFYGLMLTPDQKYRDAVTALTKQVAFSVQGIDKIKFIHSGLPMFIVRAGQDMDIFNQAIDHFVSAALAANAPLILVNYAEGMHGFDLANDSDQSRDIIQQSLAFLKFHLNRKSDHQ